MSLQLCHLPLKLIRGSLLLLGVPPGVVVAPEPPINCYLMPEEWARLVREDRCISCLAGSGMPDVCLCFDKGEHGDIIRVVQAFCFLKKRLGHQLSPLLADLILHLKGDVEVLSKDQALRRTTVAEIIWHI